MYKTKNSVYNFVSAYCGKIWHDMSHYKFRRKQINICSGCTEEKGQVGMFKYKFVDSHVWNMGIIWDPTLTDELVNVLEI
jgi:hypothetical protein